MTLGVYKKKVTLHSSWYVEPQRWPSLCSLFVKIHTIILNIKCMVRKQMVIFIVMSSSTRSPELKFLPHECYFSCSLPPMSSEKKLVNRCRPELLSICWRLLRCSVFVWLALSARYRVYDSSSLQLSYCHTRGRRDNELKKFLKAVLKLFECKECESTWSTVLMHLLARQEDRSSSVATAVGSVVGKGVGIGVDSGEGWIICVWPCL